MFRPEGTETITAVPKPGNTLYSFGLAWFFGGAKIRNIGLVATQFNSINFDFFQTLMLRPNATAHEKVAPPADGATRTISFRTCTSYFQSII